MKDILYCPRTGVPLTEVDIDGIHIEISTGCGGIFFDNFELQHFDEEHEPAGNKLLDISSLYHSSEIDFSQRIKCPKHPLVVMRRHFFSPFCRIDIDVCPECNGVWLDPGELAEIRDAFPKENIKKLTTERYISEIVASGGWSEHFENVDEAHLSISRISRMMVWIRD